MHDATGCATTDAVKNGDTWLAQQLPTIFASSAYKKGGAVLVTWDESEKGDFPIGMIVLSPLAKGHGYANTVAYSHSSTLRTMQEIFGVGPFLRDAANATSLRDLFTAYP
jgi:phosphatidylinositol-3-phosphatase